MLRELTREGVSADIVVGSSVGAINASYFASAPNPGGIENLEKIWRSLRRHDVFPFTLRSLFGLLGRPDNLIDPSNLRRLLERHLPFPNLEDAAIPVHVIATNLGGTAVCLSSGPAVDAIMASAAIPGAFPPVSHRRRPPHGRRGREQHTDPHGSQIGRHPHYRPSSGFYLRNSNASEWRDRACVACDHPSDR
ncbi:patatin-like phospholipase family protein [Methylocapsa sp. D3K7]|nr:patatin-like phospholipase family protein [Methylocapsa sp. D3K7]WGJ16600.1 patatin-like phospholipase family protein [Methylocapsa sp. D3K7]